MARYNLATIFLQSKTEKVILLHFKILKSADLGPIKITEYDTFFYVFIFSFYFFIVWFDKTRNTTIVDLYLFAKFMQHK